ncbi:SDR family NAD(P)-dependent oxidoreductase [Cupriavidus pinatubonensis]|uniref:SDR family NAD(P)-dependent oxidoreductase n=1 Tax=Cupriavidus pinatubonensis TaxID=248026 RepID=UPI001125EB55|nr:SDR family oxidoreductase [Cupriavidus pinatubonensis]TPQ39769.1 short-chain dehydrogenase [Cupriavidus pinatubonensis]
MTNLTSVHAPVDSGVPESARDFSVKDRVVIITGAGQGIGREFARQYAAAGAIPVVADLNEERAQTVLKEIEAAGGRGMAIGVDVGDKVSVDEMAAAVLEKYGRIDVLLNNAAIFATLQKRPFDAIPVPEWELVMRVNVTGSFLCACAVAPAMREAGWGRIINISSDSVPVGATNYLHYVTSKSATIGMTNALARELGPHGINVNCIRPGAVATEVDRTVNPTQERRNQLLSEQCLRRGQTPPDLVGLAMFLATPAASFITGQTIACDGGYTHSS